MLSAQLILFGLLGHFETDAGSDATSLRLFKSALVILAFHPMVTVVPWLFFGFQFINTVSGSLADIEKDHAKGMDALTHAQIHITVAKVTPCPSFSLQDWGNMGLK